jgi:peptide/nickel transport system permease protein
MLAYIFRRTLYAIPILIAVNLLLFVLFFMVNNAESMARRVLGEKNISQKQIDDWVREHNYHLPRFVNRAETGGRVFTETIFWKKNLPLFRLDFGVSDNSGRLIWEDMRERIPYSLSITVPMMLLGLLIHVFLSMIIAFYRGSYVDTAALFVTVILMSISSLFYIIIGQFLFAREWCLFPISGYGEGVHGYVKFLTLPVIIGLLSGMGGLCVTTGRFFLRKSTRIISARHVRRGLGRGRSCSSMP